MAEVCRSQLRHWHRHGASLPDGQIVDDTLLHRLIHEEAVALRDELDQRWTTGPFGEACELLDALTFTDEFAEFLTIPAYEIL